MSPTHTLLNIVDLSIKFSFLWTRRERQTKRAGWGEGIKWLLKPWNIVDVAGDYGGIWGLLLRRFFCRKKSESFCAHTNTIKTFRGRQKRSNVFASPARQWRPFAQEETTCAIQGWKLLEYAWRMCLSRANNGRANAHTSNADAAHKRRARRLSVDWCSCTRGRGRGGEKEVEDWGSQTIEQKSARMFSLELTMDCNCRPSLMEVLMRLCFVRLRCWNSTRTVATATNHPPDMKSVTVGLVCLADVVCNTPVVSGHGSRWSPTPTKYSRALGEPHLVIYIYPSFSSFPSFFFPSL